jgi:hypothetical protein
LCGGESKKGELLLHGQFTFVSVIFKYFPKPTTVLSQEYNELCAKMLLREENLSRERYKGAAERFIPLHRSLPSFIPPFPHFVERRATALNTAPYLAYRQYI